MNKQAPILSKRGRLQLSVRFRLRSGQKTGEQSRQLYIRLKVNGTECTDYGSGLFIRPTQWNVTTQRVTGFSKLAQESNREIDNIIADHRRILDELNRLHLSDTLPLAPTAESLRFHWIEKIPLTPTLTDAYDTYLRYLESLEGTPEGRDKRTLSKWKNGADYLREYVQVSKSEKLSVDLVTTVWAKGFYHHLLKRPLGKASAARFVGHLRASINHLVAIQEVGSNPIASYFPDKGKDKDVYFLESVHIDRLWTIECATETHSLVRDWLLLMCYTGMDLPDLERYVLSPESFEEEDSQVGTMIVINRGKTDITACIPKLPEVGRILANYPSGMPTFTNQTHNRFTYIIQVQIGFEQRLTTKICRKTAGALFLRMGLRIEEVSKVLGHSSIQTTMRNYLRVTSAMVKSGMMRIKSNSPDTSSSNTPFRRVA